MANKKQGWQKGEGGFSKSSDLKFTRVPAIDGGEAGKKGTDISNVVDRSDASTHDAGGGKLQNPGTRNVK